MNWDIILHASAYDGARLRYQQATLFTPLDSPWAPLQTSVVDECTRQGAEAEKGGWSSFKTLNKF